MFKYKIVITKDYLKHLIGKYFYSPKWLIGDNLKNAKYFGDLLEIKGGGFALEEYTKNLDDIEKKYKETCEFIAIFEGIAEDSNLYKILNEFEDWFVLGEEILYLKHNNKYYKFTHLYLEEVQYELALSETKEEIIEIIDNKIYIPYLDKDTWVKTPIKCIKHEFYLKKKEAIQTKS